MVFGLLMHSLIQIACLIILHKITLFKPDAMSHVCIQELEWLRLEDYIVEAHLRHNKMCLITTKQIPNQ